MWNTERGETLGGILAALALFAIIGGGIYWWFLPPAFVKACAVWFWTLYAGSGRVDHIGSMPPEHIRGNSKREHIFTSIFRGRVAALSAHHDPWARTEVLV